MAKDTGSANDTGVFMRSVLQRIATGPELSKDITLEEARQGMSLVLDGKVHPVQAALFLIALRMKRETDEENKGILEAVRDATVRTQAAVDEVVDIADPYDGCNRTLPAAPFLPAVLSACGVATVSHGVESMGPKYGVTHRQVLRAAGAEVNSMPEQAAQRIGNKETGWSYIDQSRFCPKLHDLAELRTLIVKRPAIATVEVMAGPVCGRRKTHLITGYVHKPYPRIYAMLARHAGFDSALLVRGTEGGVIPSLRQTGKFFFYRDRGDNSEEQSIEVSPTDLGIEQELRAVPLPEDLPPAAHTPDRTGMKGDVATAAQAAAQAGLEALDGKPGPTRDALTYGAAACLWHLGRSESMAAAAQSVRAVIDSGSALAHFRSAP
ncbi:MAG: anthranilate phosphoribosyltransferase [Gammaproteobacteria bacterium]